MASGTGRTVAASSEGFAGEGTVSVHEVADTHDSRADGQVDARTDRGNGACQFLAGCERSTGE